jgi:hypothetical protein
LKTRGLHALAREKAVERRTVDAKHASYTHCVQATVVNQAPDRFRMNAELIGYFPHADERGGVFVH